MKRVFGLLAFLTLLCAPSVQQVAQADLIKQNSSYHRMVLMTLASDHVTGATGLTLTITESKAGAAFGAATPTVTERGNGWYDVLLTSADDATLGQLAMHITGAAADPTDTLDQIVAFDPSDASLLGLTGVATLANQTSNATAVGAINTKLGTPAGASIAADIAANTSSLGTLTTRLPQAILFNGSGFVRSQVESYASLEDPATIVLGATASSYNTANTIGNKINSAASAGDPWSTALPGSYASGSAGYILGTNLNATVSSRMASGNVTVGGYATGQDPATLILAATVDGSLTVKQMHALAQAVIAGKFTLVRNTTAKTLTVTYYRADGTTTLAVLVTTYSDTALTIPTGRTVTFSNLP